MNNEGKEINIEKGDQETRCAADGRIHKEDCHSMLQPQHQQREEANDEEEEEEKWNWVVIVDNLIRNGDRLFELNTPPNECPKYDHNFS
mmetsp:Transcript_29391/g.34599  ORF Transcript_29391/g.34599 Transcript_29391/m.34599 type:complete len:89 (-) Transcript_29391:137-403(-)